ncbi:MAG: restriction endonuclease subunit S [Saprospiraceae bacterium]
MKQGWEIKKLGEVCDLKSGTTISPSLERDEGDVLYTKVADMNLPENIIEINTSSRFVNSAEIKQNQIIPEGAIIFPKRGGAISTNKKRKIIKPTIVDLNTMAIIPGKKINKDYFFHWFQLFDLNDISNGANIPQINNYSFDEVYIPYPVSLPEQKRIVAILDEAFVAIAKAKANAHQNLQNAKELFESYLQGVFEKKGDGWEEKTLGEVLEKTETVDPTKKPNEEFIYLDVSSVNKETKEIENATVLLGKDAPSRARKLVRTNDVIFATVRPTHSRVALITEEYDEQVCSTGYFVLRAKDFLNNNFVFYFLLTYGFNKQMEQLQKGASYPAVTDAEVKSILIPFPKSLEIQQTIIQKLDALSAETKKLEAIYQQKINDLEELKKSILQKAFNGELKTNAVTE